MVIKPTFYELAQPKMNKRAMAALKSAMKDAQRSQERLLKEAARLEKQT